MVTPLDVLGSTIRGARRPPGERPRNRRGRCWGVSENQSVDRRRPDQCQVYETGFLKVIADLAQHLARDGRRIHLIHPRSSGMRLLHLRQHLVEIERCRLLARWEFYEGLDLLGHDILRQRKHGYVID